MAAASTYSTTFILDTDLAFLIPYVTYNVECHIFKAGNIPATSRDLMAFISFKEQLLHAFLCAVFCAMSC